jgi:hypothetical protein
MNGLGPCAAVSTQPSRAGACAMSVAQSELVVSLQGLATHLDPAGGRIPLQDGGL